VASIERPKARLFQLQGSFAPLTPWCVGWECDILTQFEHAKFDYPGSKTEF